MHTLFCPLWLVQYEDYGENHFPFKTMQVSSSFGFQLLLDATVDGVHRLFNEQISRILYMCLTTIILFF